jgi:hypothetical protein
VRSSQGQGSLVLDFIAFINLPPSHVSIWPHFGQDYRAERLEHINTADRVSSIVDEEEASAGMTSADRAVL